MTESSYCQACFMDKPVAGASPDPRYCQGCYDFLLKEAEMLPAKSGRPEWIPKPQKALVGGGEISHDAPEKPSDGIFKGDTTPDNGKTLSIDGAINMSTLGSKKIEVDATKPPATPRTAVRGGPEQKALPQELIKQWAGEGMGSRAIASRLNRELGIKISYKTIQRALSRKNNANCNASLDMGAGKARSEGGGLLDRCQAKYEGSEVKGQ